MAGRRARFERRRCARAGRLSSTAARGDVLPPHRLARRSSKASSGIVRTTSSPSAAGRSWACCRWPRFEAASSAIRWFRCLFASTAVPRPTDADAERALIDAAAELARSLDVDHLELRDRAVEVSRLAAPGPVRHVPQADRCRMSRPICWPIPRKQRAMVRKGIKNGLNSEIDESVDRFFALYADNVHRHGTPPFAKRYFARLRDVFGDRLRGAHGDAIRAASR